MHSSPWIVWQIAPKFRLEQSTFSCDLLRQHSSTKVHLSYTLPVVCLCSLNSQFVCHIVAKKNEVMRKSSKIWRCIQNGFLVAALLGFHTACETDEGEIGVDPTPVAENLNFIPTKGHRNVYNVVSDGSAAQATRWISAETDSMGINVSTMNTEISAFGQAILLNDNIFSIKGKTYTEIKIPDAWYMSINMLDALPDIDVTKTEIIGYPAYITMDNVIGTESVLEVDGPIQQEQHVYYTDHEKKGTMKQILLLHPGKAIVETVTVPAGNFVCNKFAYQITKTITINVEGHTDTMDAVENITLWVAHGVGMVKQESFSESAVPMPSATGGLQLVKSSSSSTTTLQNIK